MKKLLLLAFGLSLNLSVLLAQVPEWQHIPGPDGGAIENFDLDGAALYALTNGGIYRSDDEAYYWQLLPNSLGTTRDKYQLRAEKGVFYAMEKGELFRSDNLGASWNPVLQKPFPFNFESERLQKYFVKGDTVLVGSLFTIYRSTDRGETWTSTADLVPASFVSIFEFKNEFFAAQDRYIYRSSNGGLSWDPVLSNAVGFTVVTATDSFLLAFYGNRTRLVRSTDGLRTWKAIDTDTLVKHLEEDPYGAYPSSWVGGSGSELYYFQLGDVHYFCPVRFCYSTDAGNTWHRGNNGDQVPMGRKLKDGTNFGHHIVLGSDQIQHSVDGAQTFSMHQEGLKCARIGQVIHQDNTVFSRTEWEGAHHSEDQGTSWERYPYSSNWVNTCQAFNWFSQTNESLLRFNREANYTKVSRTNDGGQTWQDIEIDYSYSSSATHHAFWHYEITWTSSGEIKKIWKLADKDTASVEVHLVDFEINEHDHLSLFGLGDRLGVEAENEIFIFDEQGGFIRKLPTIPCLSISIGEPIILYFDGYTYYNFCRDRWYILPLNATDWQEIYPQDWTTGIPLYHSRMMFFVPKNGIIWVGLEGKGLFYATDNTGRFYPVQPQMPYPYPTTISFDENNVWVGTDGGGIWTYPLPKPLSDPTKNAAFKVFPNPSIGELNLQSDQFFKEEIAFALFDAAGKKLAKKVLPPGQYWDLVFTDLPKGLYFLQMRTESGVFGLKWVVGN